jgi:hypothetical protein
MQPRLDRRSVVAVAAVTIVAAAAVRAAQDDALKGMLTADALVERAREIDVRSLEAALPSLSLEGWLGEIAGERSVRWEVNDCGEQTGDPALDRERLFPACVEATIALAPGRSASVSIIAGSWRDGRIVPGRPALRHAVINSGGTPAFVNTLAAWQEAIESARRVGHRARDHLRNLARFGDRLVLIDLVDAARRPEPAPYGVSATSRQRIRHGEAVLLTISLAPV